MAQGIPKLNCKRLKSHKYLPLSLFVFSLSSFSCYAFQPSEEYRFVNHDLELTSFPRTEPKIFTSISDLGHFSFFYDPQLKKFPFSKEVKIFNPYLPNYYLNVEGAQEQLFLSLTPSEELQNWLSDTSSNLSALITNKCTVLPQKESFYNPKENFKNTGSLIAKAYSFTKVFFETPKLEKELETPEIILTSRDYTTSQTYGPSDLAFYQEIITDKVTHPPVILTLKRTEEKHPNFTEVKSTISTSEEKIELEKIPVVLKELPEIFNSCFLAVEDAIMPSYWDAGHHSFSMEGINISHLFDSKKIINVNSSEESIILATNSFDESKFPIQRDYILPKAEIKVSLESIDPVISSVNPSPTEDLIVSNETEFSPQNERDESINIDIKNHNPKISYSQYFTKNIQLIIKEFEVYSLNRSHIKAEKSNLEFHATDIFLESSSNSEDEFSEELGFLDYLIGFRKNNTIQHLEKTEESKTPLSKYDSYFSLELQKIIFPINVVIHNPETNSELSKDLNFHINKESTSFRENHSLYCELELVTKEINLLKDHNHEYFVEMNKKLPSEFLASLELQDKKSDSIMGHIIKNYPKILEEHISYLEMLSSNEDVFNPLEIANIEKNKSSVDFSYRSLLRKKGLDYLSLMPSLKDLNTYVLSTEFRNETEVIASPDGESYYFSVKLHPYYPEDLRNIHQNVFFVLDQSRTISEERFETFKKGILRSIPYLNSDATFNIVILNKNCDVMSHTCLNNDKGALALAKAFLDNISYGFIVAPQDYTKALDTIQKRFSIDETTLNTVILLTDGAYYKNYHISSERIFDLCNNNNNIFQIYTVAASQDNYLGALDMISYHNHGDLLYSKTHAALPRQLAVLVKNLRNPVANHLHLSVVRNESNAIEFFPKSGQLPAIFANQPLTIYGKTDRLQNIDLMIQGKAENEWINITQKINLRQAIHGGRELLRTCQMLEKKLNYFTATVEQDET